MAGYETETLTWMLSAPFKSTQLEENEALPPVDATGVLRRPRCSRLPPSQVLLLCFTPSELQDLLMDAPLFLLLDAVMAMRTLSVLL